MIPTLPGLHHITAIASDPQQNVDFYTGVLGLRLVKITINYDDPGSYHLYYGDEAGNPGSILTFFAWPGAFPGRRGTAQATVTSFSVPEGSLGDWQNRFDQHHVRYEPPIRRWDEEALTFYDPDGLQLELVAHLGAEERAAWGAAPIPLEMATRGFHSVTLSLKSSARTARLLTETMGFQLLREEENRARYVAGENGTARTVDILTLPDMPQGSVSVGSVHHVAWRTPTDAQQQAWQETLAKQRHQVSPVMDRQYFHSIYFREPGGVLFEIATDAPGFTADEPLETLGTRLCLPEWLEPNRDQIQRRLLKLTLPKTGEGACIMTNATGRASSFVHRFVPASQHPEAAPTLLLLHGTGGNENDLLGLGSALVPGANLLSPRGKVLEQGMPRFFRRLAEGVFDQADLQFRTGELAEFLTDAAEQYGFDAKQVIAVGYSNGANIVGSLLLRQPERLAAAVLLHPMVPFVPETLPNLTGKGIFIGAGRNDPIVPVANTEALIALFEKAGAEVVAHWHRGGHSLTQEEVQAAQGWLLAQRRLA